MEIPQPTCFLFTCQVYKVGDAGDAFALLGGGGGHQRARGDKQHIVQHAPFNGGQDMPAQYRRRTAASRSARMNILRLSVKQHQSAVVIVVRKKDPVSCKQFFEHC